MNPKMTLQRAICERFESYCRANKLKCPDRIELLMNLHYADKSIPLDFDKLLAADNFDFLHDIYGIDRHMDKGAAKLVGGFVPRCAAKQEEVTTHGA